MEQTQTLRPGSLLYKGDYRIVSVLGRGGFGITYLAVIENLGKQVAIKEFFPQGMYNRGEDTVSVTAASLDTAGLADKLKDKFIKEARRLAGLRHDSIVPVSNAFEENGTAYYVMDFIEGRDLRSVVRDGGPLPVDVAVNYIRHVGAALEYLHNRKINHLDVKPANILVDPANNRAVLIDFGLSKQYDSDDRQTSTTPVGISPGYAPNEQNNPGGVSRFSAPTDIYSLGATLYFLLTGTTPPTASELAEEPLRFPSTMPAYIQAAIRRAMAFTRVDRYQTVADFLAALNPGVATQPTPPKPLVTDDTKLPYDPNDAAEIQVDMPKQAESLKPNIFEYDPDFEESSDDKASGFQLRPVIVLICVIIATIFIVLSLDKCGGEDTQDMQGYNDSINRLTEFYIRMINEAGTIEALDDFSDRYGKTINSLPENAKHDVEEARRKKLDELIEQSLREPRADNEPAAAAAPVGAH